MHTCVRYKAHLSMHISQETATGLLTKGPREAPIESCGSREWRGSERAETTSYTLPIKMFAYNSASQISQEINPSSSSKIIQYPPNVIESMLFPAPLTLQKGSGKEKAALQWSQAHSGQTVSGVLLLTPVSGSVIKAVMLRVASGPWPPLSR